MRSYSIHAVAQFIQAKLAPVRNFPRKRIHILILPVLRIFAHYNSKKHIPGWRFQMLMRHVTYEQACTAAAHVHPEDHPEHAY